MFAWSVGVQWDGSNEWSVREPVNSTGTKPTQVADKVEPPETWIELGLTNKT